MDLIADKRSDSEKTLQLKILVVDDDALNQRMMRVLLTREGHQVEVASNGQEAFEAVKSQRFDIVFMDLQMPVMDGVEASRRIREWENGDKPHTFIVALTASYLPEQGHTLFEAGIDNYISKPFELDHIQRLLKYSSRALASSSKASAELDQEISAHEVLDTQKGLRFVGGDPEVYKELLSEFIQELPEKLQLLQHYFAENDLKKLSRAAHNLKGVSANLGALQLSEYASRLDKQSNDGYTASVEDLLREIGTIESKLIETSYSFLSGK